MLIIDTFNPSQIHQTKNVFSTNRLFLFKNNKCRGRDLNTSLPVKINRT